MEGGHVGQIAVFLGVGFQLLPRVLPAGQRGAVPLLWQPGIQARGHKPGEPGRWAEGRELAAGG